jgi:hypothetical protein
VLDCAAGALHAVAGAATAAIPSPAIHAARAGDATALAAIVTASVRRS